MLTFGNKGKGFSLQSHSPFKNLLPFSKPRSISEMGSMRIKRHLCSNKHFFFDKEGNAIMTHKLRNATIQLPILDTKIRKWDFFEWFSTIVKRCIFGAENCSHFPDATEIIMRRYANTRSVIILRFTACKRFAALGQLSTAFFWSCTLKQKCETNRMTFLDQWVLLFPEIGYTSFLKNPKIG